MRKSFKFKEEDIREEIVSEREANRKVYRMKNGLRMMAITGEPMHYRNEETGKYEEINTELKECEHGLVGKCGECEITLPNGKNNADSVKLKKGATSIEWEFLGVNTSGEEKKKRTIKKHPRPFVDEVPTHMEHMRTKGKKHTFAQYNNVDDGIDIEYEVRNNALKENIVVRSKREKYEFDFKLHLKNLVPFISEDNRSVEFIQPEEKDVQFRIPRPIMIDAKQNCSEEVEYELNKSDEGEYILTVKADSEWINDADRAMPVSIDPVVEYTNAHEGYVDYINSERGHFGIAAGFDGTSVWTSSIMAYVNSIPSGVTVTRATLSLEKYRSTGDANFCFAILGGNDGNGGCLDGAIGIAANTGNFHMDVTSSVMSAIASGNMTSVYLLAPYYRIDDNSGIVITSTRSSGTNCCDEEESTDISDIPTGSIEFYSSTAVLYVEYLDSIEYTDNPTIEYIRPDYSSAADNVNLFTGELMHRQGDIGTNGVAFPINVTHRFELNKRRSDIGYGNGWNLSIEQSVNTVSDSVIVAEYWDSDGKKHYFVNSDDGCTDTSGLNLTFCEVESGYMITDRSGGKLEFDSEGKIAKISDANGNSATITRDSSGRIVSVCDNFGRTVTMTYGGSKLEKMTDPAGREVTYTYDSDNLVTITFPDGVAVQYTYDSEGRISMVTHEDGTKTVYKYTTSTDDGGANRVSRVEKYPAGADVENDDPEEYRSIRYKTTQRTEVTDRTGVTRVYVFDQLGRTLMDYEEGSVMECGCDECGNLVETSSKTATDAVVYQYADKKRTFASSVRSARDEDNMIIDGNFLNPECDAWVGVGQVSSSDGYYKAHCRILGSASGYKRFKQTIDASRVKMDYGDTLILSAWGMSSSGVTTTDDGDAKFEIRAEVHYAGDTTEEFSSRFDPTYSTWQYAATPVRIDPKKTLDYIDVYLDYSRNIGFGRFDNVRLVNAPAQYAEYEKDLHERITIFGTEQIIRERVTAYDGIYKTVDEKNMSYDVVRRTVTDLDGNAFVGVFKYDSAHRVIMAQNERNIITETTYNSVGMQTSVKSYYWATFNPETTPDPVEYFYQATTYDETGEFATEVGDNRSEDIKTTNNYNKTKGLLLGTTSPNGQNTSYEYNAQNDLVTKVSATVGDNEYSVLYSYDPARRLSAITHNGFNYGFTYDGMGRAAGVSIADTVYTTNDYTLTDTTTVSTTYAGGEKMTVVTDKHNNPVSRTYTDKDGNETVIATGEYDSLGKPIEVIDNLTEKVYTYVYDTYENVTEEKVNGEAFKAYEYDRHNRLEKTTITVGDGTQVYKPIYDKRDDDNAVYPGNSVIGVELEGKFTVQAEHDELGRTTSKALTLKNAENSLISEEISYLSVTSGTKSRLTNIVESFTNKVNGTTTDALTYTYDNNGNITEVKRNNVVLIQYAYDGLNQLIREDNAVLGKIYTFTYDTAGNITEKKILNRTALGVGVLEQTIPYAYATTDWKDRLTSYNGESITYDALGNPTTYRGHNLTWGKIKQLEAFDSNTFAYNAEGIRIRKNNITYELDGTKILREVRSTGAIEYYYGINGVAGFRYNNADYYYQKNLQGDVTAIYNTTGTKVAEYVYDAWGNCTVTLDTNGIGTINPFRYRSYYFDTETCLYYLQTRYYDPEIGRFINADTYVSTGQGIIGNNMFAYCGNNPANGIDPYGTFFFHWIFLNEIAKSVVSIAENKSQEYGQAIKYDVPLYKQGGLSLCYAFCQTMIESYNSGTTLTQREARSRAIEIAQEYHGSTKRSAWNKEGWPTNIGKEITITNINDLYDILKENGPVYAYYDTKDGAHLIVTTGVDLHSGIVYTNNPWGISGAQTFEEFQNGFVTEWYHFSNGKSTSSVRIWLID